MHCIESQLQETVIIMEFNVIIIHIIQYMRCKATIARKSQYKKKIAFGCTFRYKATNTRNSLNCDI